MKFWIFEINMIKKSTIDSSNKGNLVVTGQVEESKLKKFEDDCKALGFKIKATNLPVLGVFNLETGVAQDGTKQIK